MEESQFAQYLKELREKEKLSMGQLSKQAKISQAYISQIEGGKRGIPSPDILKKLSGPLNISYNELMYMAGHFNDHEYRSISEYEARVEEINNKLENVLNVLSEDGEFLPNVIIDLLPIFQDEHFSGMQYGYLNKFFDQYIETKEFDAKFLEEFHENYNVKEIKQDLLNYTSMDYKEKYLNQLENVAVKHNLLESNTNDLADFLIKEDITYKQHPITDTQRNLLIAYLGALFPDKK